MRGKKTSPEKIEEIKALSLVYSPATIAEKTEVSLRTVYEVLKQKDSPQIEAIRQKKRQEIVEKVWDDKKGEILKLKTKGDMLLEAIDEEKIARSRLTELSTAYGILFDKRRLLSDESTENYGLAIYNFIKEVKKERDRLDGYSSREQSGETG